MSRSISGQLRIVDKSSNGQGEYIHTGIGHSAMKSLVPDLKLQLQPNLKKDASHRGMGKGEKGELAGSTDLLHDSTFVEPWSFFSVGHGLLLQDNKDENSRSMRREGKRVIDIPKREGKTDTAGQLLPAKKHHKAPTNHSDIVEKQTKLKGIRYIKPTDKKKTGAIRDFKEALLESHERN
tara:strand:- start:2921 stop:3460 length:540 start_codon:yes stop_codon:yes gene_type:complete